MAARAPLLDVARFESAFQALTDQVDAQAREIAQLRGELERRPTAEQVQAAMRAAEERVAGVERRAAQLEADTALDGPAAVGACVAANQRAIHGLLQTAAQKADAAHVDAVAAAGMRAVDELGVALRRERAEQSVVNMLEASQRELQAQLAALETVTAGKMNKSDVSRLEAAATRLLAFEAFEQRVEEDAGAAGAHREQLQQTLDAAVGECAALRRDAAELRAGLDRAATAAALAGVRRELAATAATAEAAAPRADFEAVAARVAAAEARLQGACDDIAKRSTGVDARLAAVDAALAQRATLAQLAERAELAAAERQWATLRAALERKAGASSLAALEESVAALAAGLARAEQQADLAARFVDWFHERGAAYEHNFAAVEKQLGRLVANSRPEDREPYDGRVRF